MKTNIWYLVATPDLRKKYKLRMLSPAIRSYKKVFAHMKQLQPKYRKPILILKRTCKIIKVCNKET